MRRTIVTLALFAMITAFGASKAHAVLLTYTYTGNNFTDAEAPFTTNDNVTGYFTIDCGLLGGAGDCASLPRSQYYSAVLSWSFTVDGFTLDSSPAVPGSRILSSKFSTDAGANIIDWDISASTLPPDLLLELGIDLNNSVILTPDYVNLQAPTTALAYADQPGRWNVSEASIPEPSTLANVLLSLAALILLLWRLHALPSRVYGCSLAPSPEP
jgi:hypothetical protein